MKLSDKILLGALIGTAFTFSPGGLFISGLFLGAVYCLSKFIKTESRGFLVKLFIFGFILRIILAIANYNVAFFVMRAGTDTQPDAVIYNNNAYHIAHLLKGSDYSRDADRDPSLRRSIESEEYFYGNRIPPIRSYQHGFFVFLISLIYSWLGYCPIAAKGLNCIFGCISAIMVYLIAMRLSGSESISRISAAISMFFPSMVYWSASLLRDTIANFFFLCYMLLLMVFIEHGRKRALLAALMSVIMLSLFKEKIIVLLGSGFIFVSASYLMGKVFKMKLLTASLTTILILTVTLVAMLNNWDAVARHLQDKAVSMLAHHQTYSTENPEASTYKIFKESIYETKELHPRDLIDISLGFSIFAGLAYYFLSPFPWYVPYGHLGLLVFYPQVILTFIFLPFMALGVLISARRNLYMTAVTVVLIAMIAVPQALAEGIIGNVVRHRDMFMPFLIIFATYGFCSIFHSRSATAGC